MSRRFAYFNFAGVAALAILCVAQWRENRRVNLDLLDSEKRGQAQEEKIAEHEKLSHGLSADLAQFKEQFSNTHRLNQAAERWLDDLQQTNSILSSERDQLRQSVTHWSQAVAQRDEIIKAANERIKLEAEDLNRAIEKFNEMTTNYNRVVGELNQARTNPAPTGAANP